MLCTKRHSMFTRAYYAAPVKEKSEHAAQIDGKCLTCCDPAAVIHAPPSNKNHGGWRVRCIALRCGWVLHTSLTAATCLTILRSRAVMAFQNNKIRIQSYWRRRRICIILMAAAFLSTPSGAFVLSPTCRHHYHTCHTMSTSSALEQLTVKELRQLLKDNELMERGLSTKLKRKQDLIDYLHQHLPPPPSKKQRIQSMPPLLQSPQHEEEEEDAKSHPLMTLSPKEVIFEKVYQRYPPLRDENFTASGVGELDIRQQLHPMLVNATLSDMDLIFVGTASCTPGVTRGVSCTALRLNWRRPMSFHSNNVVNGQYPSAPPPPPPQEAFTGGTWLFDVGEGTQVCFFYIRGKCWRAKDEIQDAGTRPRTDLFSCPVAILIFITNSDAN